MKMMYADFSKEAETVLFGCLFFVCLFVCLFLKPGSPKEGKQRDIRFKKGTEGKID